MGYKIFYLPQKRPRNRLAKSLSRVIMTATHTRPYTKFGANPSIGTWEAPL